MAFFWNRWSLSKPPSAEEYQQELDKLREKAPIPTLWLYGKTGSGKSSVVHYLTGAEAATIGEGFRPQTRTSRQFDFPNSEEPLLRFLDTRGLGEASYDPQEDIEKFAATTQLMIVTVRVTDHALEDFLTPLRRIRKAAPLRPILLVVTCLHQATGQLDISAGPDPFEPPAPDAADQVVAPGTKVPDGLQTLIDEKIMQFVGLYDMLIAIDLTKPEDGFADPNFGGQRLKNAILEYLPHAYRQSLIALDSTKKTNESYRQKRSRWQILASSSLAATAGAVPVPWVDIPAVLGIQAHLAYQIAEIYEQEITPANWAVLSSAAGSRIAFRLAIREALKFIPIVGMAAGAASSFAFTYALGMSWDWYFSSLRHGNVPTPEQLREIFGEELKRGRQLWGTNPK